MDRAPASAAREVCLLVDCVRLSGLKFIDNPIKHRRGPPHPQVKDALNLQVVQLAAELEKKNMKMTQLQRKAGLEVAGERAERARVQAIEMTDKKREQVSNKRKQKRLKTQLEATELSLEGAHEEKREEQKQTVVAVRNQKKVERRVGNLEQENSAFKLVLWSTEMADWREREAGWTNRGRA